MAAIPLRYIRFVWKSQLWVQDDIYLLDFNIGYTGLKSTFEKGKRF